jgi:uncharacterized protein involved in response to NO
VTNSISNFALFNYGFRPFFLLAGLYAVIAMLVWLFTLVTGIWPEGPLVPHLWHAHEMLFGFVGAAVAGFLLTAVPSWTGQRGFSGTPLIILASAWLAGRIVFSLPAIIPPVIIAFVDLAFFPLLGLMLSPSLLRGKSRNLVFLLFLLVLFVSNLLFHIGLMRGDIGFASYGLLLGVNTILLIIAIIGGRIVPAFTLSAIRRTDDTFVIMPFPALDRIAILSVLLILITDLLWPYTAAAGWIALVAALIHTVRLARWKTLRGLSEAIVWILHIAYAWAVIGLALKGIFLLTGSTGGTAWLHAITTGAFATMILAVMTRAALGHTGRPLIAPPLIVVAYVLITLAAIIRVLGPVFPEYYLYSIAVSGALWVAAFGLFLVVYTPILIGPRADGKPG